jgi:hypothetical protein
MLLHIFSTANVHHFRWHWLEPAVLCSGRRGTTGMNKAKGKGLTAKLLIHLNSIHRDLFARICFSEKAGSPMQDGFPLSFSFSYKSTETSINHSKL